MRGRALIDTNVLVYAYDISEPEKQTCALDLLHGLAERETGVVSTLIMEEMFVVLTRKLSSPLSVEQAVGAFARHICPMVVRGDEPFCHPKADPVLQ
ncbi:MAG: PIN domain-containing protein [Firmicutes bacterium]|jgi:predicted nucleic acid-binding protein|nr:PIN domain-containing protein [Bacillota bacterium]MDD4336828.1 PIN domain-containing protein [Bacillota bacterium]MDD4791448.1 PIN domain-containing protein [Bacillota bacterium]